MCTTKTTPTTTRSSQNHQRLISHFIAARKACGKLQRRYLKNAPETALGCEFLLNARARFCFGTDGERGRMDGGQRIAAECVPGLLLSFLAGAAAGHRGLDRSAHLQGANSARS